jgi:DNA-binding XRE family transcriptional regulator
MAVAAEGLGILSLPKRNPKKSLDATAIPARLEVHMRWKDWIENELETRGMSKAELARRAGVSRQAVWGIINREKPPFRCFVYLAVCLDIATTYDEYKDIYSKIKEEKE